MTTDQMSSDENLRTEWVDNCLLLMKRRSDLYPHDRKIVRNWHITFEVWDDSLGFDDLGYTDKKGADLTRLYLHEESRAKALELWEERKPGKMKHVAFHCFGHYSKRAGVNGEQGPCLNSVTVTALPNGQVAANIAYRSTDFLKKFAADLVFLRDVLLEPFGRIDSVTCDIPNVTVHPLYFLVPAVHLDDPAGELQKIERCDPRFHQAVKRQTDDLLNDGPMNRNFASAQRVKRFALERMDPKTLKELKAYLSAKGLKSAA
jgi:hypothetical protein